MKIAAQISAVRRISRKLPLRDDRKALEAIEDTLLHYRRLTKELARIANDLE